MAKARQNLDATQDRVRLWEKLAEIEWDDIDVPRWQEQVMQGQRALDDLTRAGSNLDTALKAWEGAKERHKEIRKKKEDAQKAEGAIESRLEFARKQFQNASELAAPGLSDVVREALAK